jgi:hypothetical protein
MDQKFKCECGNDLVITIADSINTDHDPQLKARLLEGGINFALCPKCKALHIANEPILYHDMKRAFMIYVYPAPPQQIPDEQKVREQIITDLRQAQTQTGLPAKDYKYDVAFGIDELKEKLSKLEAEREPAEKR